MAPLAEVEAVVGEEPPVCLPIGQLGGRHIGQHRMGYNGKVLAMELRQSGNLHVQLLPPDQGVPAFSKLGAIEAIVDQAMASHPVHHEALQGNLFHGAQDQWDIRQNDQVDQQSGQYVPPCPFHEPHHTHKHTDLSNG